MTQICRPFPEIYQVFELTTNKEIDCWSMTRMFFKCLDWNDVTGCVYRWHFGGKKEIKGGITKCFKLVRAGGSCKNLTEIRRKLAMHGRIPASPWIQVFEEAYGSVPHPLVGVANRCWEESGRFQASFPAVLGDGARPYFMPADIGGLNQKEWLWLVEVDDQLPRGVSEGSHHIDAPNPSRG